MIFFKKTLYNCKQATLLIVKKSETSLSLKERCQLFYHLLFCDPCNNFKKQSGEIDKMLHSFNDHLSQHPSHHLPDKKKQEIDTLLKED